MSSRISFCIAVLCVSNMAGAWGLRNTEAPTAWQKNVYGKGVIIAMLDTGVEINHPALVNQIAYNDGERGVDAYGRDKRNNNFDDDGNGLVDDWAGYDFANRSGRVIDYANFGTMMAGVVAADHQDKIYDPNKVQGLAPQAKVLPIKIISRDNRANFNDIIAGLDYAVQRGAQIINIGWTLNQDFPALRQKIRDLARMDILVVSSAGDNGRDIDIYPVYPASYGFGNQIVVGAHAESRNGVTRFTNFGQNSVQLMAPGAAIRTTSTGRRQGVRSGSGMAASFVSGAAALLWSFRPEASVYDIVDAVVAGTTYEASYQKLCWSEGRLNVEGAMTYLEQLYPDPEL